MQIGNQHIKTQLARYLPILRVSGDSIHQSNVMEPILSFCGLLWLVTGFAEFSLSIGFGRLTFDNLLYLHDL